MTNRVEMPSEQAFPASRRGALAVAVLGSAMTLLLLADAITYHTIWWRLVAVVGAICGTVWSAYWWVQWARRDAAVPDGQAN